MTDGCNPLSRESIIQKIKEYGFNDYYGGTYKLIHAHDMDWYSIEDAYMISVHGTPHYPLDEKYFQIVKVLYPSLEQRDGKDHINVYSKGKTRLGTFLSNFTKHKINTEDGEFNSIEGYWYFLSCGDEKLRELSGWEAKAYGRKVGAKDWIDTELFKYKICKAIETKIRTSSYINQFINSKLEFKHYYNYYGKIIEPKEGKWIMEFLDILRTRLQLEKQDERIELENKELYEKEYKEYLRLKEKFGEKE